MGYGPIVSLFGLHVYCASRRSVTKVFGNEESNEGRMADALAHRGDEGRDKLREAACRCKYPLMRGFPNGTTHLSEGQVSLQWQ